MEELLRMEHISKRFPGVQALNDAFLSLRKGETLALIGENGAGKTTLMKVLLGMHAADEGTITLKGESVQFSSPSDALGHGISMIHQEISLVPQMTVAENIWLGREARFSSFGVLSAKKRERATRELLERLGVSMNTNALVESLNVANMQMVEIVRAISYNSSIIIMDEPTSALSGADIDILFNIIRNLNRQGVSVIFISHKINEMFTICDRVTVMRDGQYIDTRNCKDINHEELIKLIVGRELTTMFPKEKADIGETVLEVRGLCGKGFHDVSFELHRGEILGFCGLGGAGRTEIMNGIFGISRAHSGEILLNGVPATIATPTDAIRQGIGMITEDRLRQGALHMLSIRLNMSLPSLDGFINKLGFVSRRREEDACTSKAEELSIVMASIDNSIGSLSGGNQQKAIIGRWLLTTPKVLIMDEPTRGIDVGAKAEIHRMLSQLAQKGMAILMVSSELPEVLGMSDRIMVVRNGTIVHECPREGATQELLMNHAFGIAG